MGLLSYTCPYQNQYQLKDPATGQSWNYAKRNASCAPTSAAMLVHARGLNKKSTVNDEAVYLFGQFGTSTAKGSVRGTVVKKLGSIYGILTANRTSRIWETIVEEIATYQRPVIFRSASIVGPQGHYVLVIGFEESANTRKIITNDPFKGAGKVYSFDQVSKKDPSIIVAQWSLPWAGG